MPIANKCVPKTLLPRETRVALPVLPAVRPAVRPSRTSRWRAGVLIGVHLLIAAHIVHWLLAGRTVSPVEPSEAMYTLNRGELNAGFLFFAAAIVATLLLGRFVCGWGCHFVAYQDLCAWLLKKAGIKPKPLRSRLLLWGPAALALYMFVWPSVYRWWAGGSFPEMSNHLAKSEFWETFPGPVVAIGTILLAGMGIVYFLGSKGFCTYACPYGGVFAPADKLAIGRIRVTDACEHCGHCTAACTSNVRVHEEVALYGMVVDPGCMKCMDCVSVCPNDALYFGLGRPAIGLKPSAPPKPVPYDFSKREEWGMAAVGLAGVLIFRGLYDQIPLLLAMGLGAMLAFVVMKSIRMIRDANVRLQNLSLKKGNCFTRVGALFGVGMALVLAVTAHSGVVQYNTWQGRGYLVRAHVGDEVWSPSFDWWHSASATQRDALAAAASHLERADRWGMLTTYSVVQDLVWIRLAENRVVDAERLVRRLIDRYPKKPEVYRGLGGVLRKQNRIDDAVAAYRRAIEIDGDFHAARTELSSLLIGVGRVEEAMTEFRAALTHRPVDVSWALTFVELLRSTGGIGPARVALELLLSAEPNSARAHRAMGVMILQAGAVHETDRALEHLRAAIAIEPGLVEAHYDLGMALLQRGDTREAIPALRVAVRLRPGLAVAHYNLAVALFMADRLDEAAAAAAEAVRLVPEDHDSRAFLEMVRKTVQETRQSDADSHRAVPLIDERSKGP